MKRVKREREKESEISQKPTTGDRDAAFSSCLSLR